MASRLWTYPVMKAATGLTYSRDQLRRLIRAGKFPAPRRIPGSHRIYFVEAEIVAWLDGMPKAEPRSNKMKDER